MFEKVTIEKDKSSFDQDKIIIEDDSNEESAKHMPTILGTSFAQPPIISIDSDNDDSASIKVSNSPPILQKGKFHEKDIGINLDVVNTILEQIILQGLDALASTTQQVIPLGPSLVSHVTYHLGSTISLLKIISQLSNQLIQEREEWKIEREPQ